MRCAVGPRTRCLNLFIPLRGGAADPVGRKDEAREVFGHKNSGKDVLRCVSGSASVAAPPQMAVKPARGEGSEAWHRSWLHSCLDLEGGNRPTSAWCPLDSSSIPCQQSCSSELRLNNFHPNFHFAQQPSHIFHAWHFQKPERVSWIRPSHTNTYKENARKNTMFLKAPNPKLLCFGSQKG